MAAGAGQVMVGVAGVLLVVDDPPPPPHADSSSRAEPDRRAGREVKIFIFKAVAVQIRDSAQRIGAAVRRGF